MTSAAYSSKELSLALQKKGIEAHRVMRFEEGGGWYWREMILRWVEDKWNERLRKRLMEINKEIVKL